MYTLLNLLLLYSSNVNITLAGDLRLDISILNKSRIENVPKVKSRVISEAFLPTPLLATTP